MPAIKPIAAIVDKYTRRAAGASQDYQTGVQSVQPTTWEANTGAAQGSWQAGVQQAAASGRFASGVVGKGAKWQRKAVNVGAARYAPGVQAAGPDYQAGFGKFHDIIAGINLDPRGPRGDPRNINRVAALATALHQMRVGGGR